MNYSILISSLYFISIIQILYHKVGKIDDDGVIYDSPYGGDPVGRYEDGNVYDNPYGGSTIWRTEGYGCWLLKEKNDRDRNRFMEGKIMGT